MTAPAPSPGPPTRSKRIYVYWGVALALLLTLGVVCWVVVPIARVRYATWTSEQVDASDAVRSVGGPDNGVRLVVNYIRSPLVPGPWKAEAMALLRASLKDCSEEVVPALASALEDSDYRVQYAAAESLRDLGPRARSAVPQLTSALAHESPNLRRMAAWALMAIGPEAGEAIPAVRTALKDETEKVRVAAAEALYRIDSTLASEAVSVLIRELNRDTAPIYRRNAANALGKIGPEAKTAVPDLTRLLGETFGDWSSEARRSAAIALGRIGSSAAPAASALEEACKDENKSVRQAAAEALKEIKKAGGE